MKTRDELLAMADTIVTRLYDVGMSDEGYLPTDVANAAANLAQACVMLARELREGENAPTFEQAERLIVATYDVVNAIRER